MTALYYSAGTVSLTNGSAVVTGIDTAWETALVVGGEIYVQAEGNPLPIASVDSDTLITAALVWTGATGVYDYVLRVGTAYDEQIAKNAEILARLLSEIEAGTIWKFDASGDTAGRAVYDTRPKGFAYLDVSGAQPVLWVKASNAEGDWNGPFSYGVGPVGPAPSLTFSPVVTGAPGTPASLVTTGEDPINLAFTIPAGLTGIRWRGAYSAGTSYLERDGVRDNGSTWIALQDTIGNAPPVLPTTSNAFWALVAAKGLDGTGTGDVVGPASSVDNRLAAFAGNTGKLLGDSGLLISAVATLSGVQALTNKTLTTPTLVLKQSTNPLPTAEGDLQWDTDDDAIVVGNGAGQKRFRATEWETIEVAEFVSVASYVRTGLAAFRTLRISGVLKPANSAVSPVMQSSVDNGASWENGASDYNRQSLLGTAATATAGGSSGNAILLGAADTEAYVSFMSVFDYFNFAGQGYVTTFFGGYRAAGFTTGTSFSVRQGSVARNALRILFSTGGVAAGRVTLEGVRG